MNMKNQLLLRKAKVMAVSTAAARIGTPGLKSFPATDTSGNRKIAILEARKTRNINSTKPEEVSAVWIGKQAFTRSSPVSSKVTTNNFRDSDS
ncbi:Hypothetical protein NTJ_12523 [Nesidiocoris tenuis]|uniref:Uncharacterized protein n=1 Tax=Nesidiocoris tenuis TaxID=355587 RepID=A0ABN7B972_9HEMI|nr:Hypothetical protein NTJ_12523 [Nesidiocoris tenuis]